MGLMPKLNGANLAILGILFALVVSIAYFNVAPQYTLNTASTSGGANCAEYEEQEVSRTCVEAEYETVTEEYCTGPKLLGACLGSWETETTQERVGCAEERVETEEVCVAYEDGVEESDEEPDPGRSDSSCSWWEVWCNDGGSEDEEEVYVEDEYLTCGGDTYSNGQITGYEYVEEVTEYSDGSEDTEQVENCIDWADIAAGEEPQVCRDGSCVTYDIEVKLLTFLQRIGLV